MNDQTPTGPKTITADDFITEAGWGAVAQAQLLLPQGQELITIDNWQEWPTLRHSFQPMREIMPSHVIDASACPNGFSYAGLGCVRSSRPVDSTHR